MKTPNMAEPKGHGMLFVYSGVSDYMIFAFLGCEEHTTAHLKRFRGKGFRWNWSHKPEYLGCADCWLGVARWNFSSAG
jgi:hypothetical protein